MSRSLRHGALAATAIVFSIAALSACGAGKNAQTLEVRPDNAATSSGDIKIQNANVVTPPEHGAEGPAAVTATVFNNGTEPETLDAITLTGGSGSVELHAAKGSGPVVVPAGGRVILGGKGNASAVIENGREATQNGNVQPLVFKFSRTGDIPLGASVVPATGYFKGFGPSALPETPKKPENSPEATPTGSASETPGASSGSPSAPASEGDTTTPSDAASDSQQPG
ncbi:MULTISPECIES: DUF461 domain-containing protein [Streptomyces]|uniref:DUF461 domain-containing protein n=1 Tax=Streptomyces poriferorum TaxID=2798799 RepID=A0ABY9IRG9_9ACTN|nr:MULTISPECIES: DUF461 domain-containing protein [unclassified Streptomyces]MDP5313640.1 DUF461 domain-containing protein [Streptomyces sp. Alt4]WLQ57394.1 DUF461 domain-containing protein [Streptomyces sp. Alt2]WSI64737.1 DUF461 domain-containing protein [Streptomyces sp. NBC_01336]